MTKCFILIILFFLATQVGYAQKSEDYYSHLQSQHQQVLKKWLGKQTWLRPAIEKDASQEDLKAWRRDNKNFQPYYAVGDFNQDSKEDFAILLKVKGKDDSAIAVFNAPFNVSKPAYFEKGYGAVGLFYIEYNEELKLLYMTAYETHGFYLKPKGKTYIAYDADEDSQ